MKTLSEPQDDSDVREILKRSESLKLSLNKHDQFFFLAYELNNICPDRNSCLS